MTLINPILETNQSSSWTKGSIDPTLSGSLKRFLRLSFCFQLKEHFDCTFYWRKDSAERKAMARKLNCDILITGH